MKKLLLALACALPLLAVAQEQVPYPASQAQVDAGTDPYPYVSPLTLANSSLIAGLSLSNITETASQVNVATNLVVASGATISGDGSLLTDIPTNAVDATFYAWVASQSGSPTPWTSDVNASQFSLTNLFSLSLTNSSTIDQSPIMSFTNVVYSQGWWLDDMGNTYSSGSNKASIFHTGGIEIQGSNGQLDIFTRNGGPENGEGLTMIHTIGVGGDYTTLSPIGASTNLVFGFDRVTLPVGSEINGSPVLTEADTPGAESFYGDPSVGGTNNALAFGNGLTNFGGQMSWDVPAATSADTNWVFNLTAPTAKNATLLTETNVNLTLTNWSKGFEWSLTVIATNTPVWLSIPTNNLVWLNTNGWTFDGGVAFTNLLAEDKTLMLSVEVDGIGRIVAGQKTSEWP